MPLPDRRCASLIWRMPTGHPRGTTPLLAGLAVLGVAAALFTAVRLVDPPPSRTLVIATASASSGYQEYAERYRNILAQQGVRLDIRPSLGSADNLNLLRDKSSGVQAAFSTIGAARPEDATEIVSLGGVFVTPVFVFYRSDETITRFAQFRGKRFAIEIAGTTLHDFILKIMRDAGVLDFLTRLTELSSTDAVQALADGRIDAAIISSADVKGPAVEMALALPGLRIMNVSEADAIAVNVPALRHIVMPRAMLSLAADQPPAALDMLGLGNALLAAQGSTSGAAIAAVRNRKTGSRRLWTVPAFWRVSRAASAGPPAFRHRGALLSLRATVSPAIYVCVDGRTA